MISEENLQEAINHRFKTAYDKLVELKKVDSQREFCAKAGINEGNFKKYYNGDRKTNNLILVNMTNAFNLSPEWLLTGEGDMFKTSIQEFAKPTDTRVEEQDIPLYDFEASAGLKKLFSNSENVLDFIRVPNLPKCDGAVHISGDSMYPLLKSGDIVMYKQIHDIANGILYGEMYLLSATIGDEDLTLVKYIQKSEKGDDYVKLVSQNKHHQDKDIPLKNIRALGYIKASIRINSMA
ncbi:phage repressor protein C with HTH and peptisase S24 domain [Pontibacter ummariensis]|uniref:Phage repressor protein C, contains Cro/C1-type HTH and peptisase s24 domains n=1 Tax=Pontibacter ummariensis TaxID=1610492 RepID=A0A239HM36_9BACT|nr:S24 family peptidase [Pontibacter ummariensis]PRY10323.1 phage repressor protein C with HTH and peptisase S24 domain [Pontibacter ummariensis]SNS82225.1 Phage repressor protein C, contains Cro/C1-type HTH and peptisase s24 domains [Pontibacter ummariensis]